MDPRKSGIRPAGIKPSTAVHVYDTKQKDGLVQGKDLTGKNEVKEHKSGAAVMGSGAKGGKPYSRS